MPPVFAVRGAPAGKDFYAVGKLDWKARLIDGVTLLDLLAQPRFEVKGGDGAIEHAINAVQKL